MSDENVKIVPPIDPFFEYGEDVKSVGFDTVLDGDATAPKVESNDWVDKIIEETDAEEATGWIDQITI